MLSKQSNLPFKISNKKTHLHISKFKEAIINNLLKRSSCGIGLLYLLQHKRKRNKERAREES